MVLQIRDAVGEVRHVFRPVVHLRTGGVVAVEARARPAAGELDQLRPVTGLAERLIRLDVLFAAAALRHASEHQRTLPLHLRLWAGTVCADQDALAPLRAALGESGRDSSEVVVRLVVPPGEAAPTRLGIGLARLRAAGLGVGLDAADTYPQATLIDAHPEVLILAARHTRGLPAAAAALAGSAALAAETGAVLIADGVDQGDQAAAVLAHGVHLAQGNLVGAWHRRPTTQSIPAALLDELTSPESISPSGERQPAHAGADDAGPLPVTLAELTHPPVTVPQDATGEAVRAAFADRPELTGLVLVDSDHHPLLTLNRDRFMLAVTGPFGHSLYANRPAAQLGDPPRTLSRDATLSQAMELVADSPAHRMYDDIVVIDTHHRCHGVLRVGDMVRDLARRHSTQPGPAGQHAR